MMLVYVWLISLKGKREKGNKGEKRDVFMEMERVEICILVVYCKLNNWYMLVCEGISYCFVNGGVEWVVVYSEGGKYGWGGCGYLVGNIIEWGLVGFIIVCLFKFKLWVRIWFSMLWWKIG